VLKQIVLVEPKYFRRE